MLLENRLGIFGGNLFDLHSARSRRHKDRLAFGAIDQNAEVQLFFDGQGFFD